MKKRKIGRQVSKLVQMSVAFYNLNKAAGNVVGLSLVQYHVMGALKDMPGTSPQELARVVGVHPSTLTHSLKSLRSKGYLFTAENPKDSRKKILSITVNGKEKMGQFETMFGSIMKNNWKIDHGGLDISS